MAKHKEESAAVKAFKAKWGNAKKPFPSEEAKALAAAEELNAGDPEPKAKPVKKEKEKKKAAAQPVEDKEREKLLAEAKKVITERTSTHHDSKNDGIVRAEKKKDKKKGK